MRAVRRTWVAAWQEALANRRSFAFQVVVMVVNDIVWVLFWTVFFRKAGDIRGWGLDQMMVLFAALTGTGGIVLGMFANVRRISELASTGGLDSLLALPTSPLLQLLSRRVNTVHIGDVLFGVVLFGWLGQPTPKRAVVFVFGVVCGALILGSFMVLMGSISFFASRTEAGDLGAQAILLFGNYPADIFSGLGKFFLYAVVPAGFVTSVPVRLVDDFSIAWAAGLVAVAAFLCLLSTTVFNLGLRRYTSGAMWIDA